MERSEEHTSELQSHSDLVCRLLLECYGPNPDLHSFPTRRSSDLPQRKRSINHHGTKNTQSANHSVIRSEAGEMCGIEVRRWVAATARVRARRAAVAESREFLHGEIGRAHV